MEWIAHKYPLDTQSLDEFSSALNEHSFEIFNRLKSVDRNIVECIREDTLTPKDTDCSLGFWDFEKGYYGNRDKHLTAMLCNIQSTLNTYCGLVRTAFGPPKEYSDQPPVFSDPYQQYTIPDF